MLSGGAEVAHSTLDVYALSPVNPSAPHEPSAMTVDSTYSEPPNVLGPRPPELLSRSVTQFESLGVLGFKSLWFQCCGTLTALSVARMLWLETIPSPCEQVESPWSVVRRRLSIIPTWPST